MLCTHSTGCSAYRIGRNITCGIRIDLAISRRSTATRLWQDAGEESDGIGQDTKGLRLKNAPYSHGRYGHNVLRLANITTARLPAHGSQPARARFYIDRSLRFERMRRTADHLCDHRLPPGSEMIGVRASCRTSFHVSNIVL